MLDRDRELALQTLAHSIRRCIETIGPSCTGRLLGTVALDLIEADKHADKAKLPGPDPAGQGKREQWADMNFHHLGGGQRLRRPTGYP
jgi:hypothetical protein